jgi:hypothetical protein
VQPHLKGGAYVNFLDNEGPERVKAAYGDNYARLLQIKRTYDPGNFFRQNQNIDPFRRVAASQRLVASAGV